MTDDLIVDINAAADWLVSLIKQVDQFNQAYPYFHKIKSGVELKRAFGTGQFDTQRAEMTRGWHVVIRRCNENPEQRVASRDRVSILYYATLINFWSDYANGASLRDANAHISAMMTMMTMLIKTKKQSEMPFNIITAQLVDVSDYLWPVPGGRLHHKSVIEVALSQRKKYEYRN